MSVIGKTLTDYFTYYAIPTNAPIGVAVSGGADSLCLALHLIELAQTTGQSLMTVTVDHGLRPESKAEAQRVKALMGQYDIPHTTLHWMGQKPKTRLEEKAREKRYELLLSWCHQNGIRYLFLAHHAGDQAETFWARLARGSGIDGLSAMAPQVLRDGIYLCRPFLNLNKKDLQANLKRRHITWAEDAMNNDEDYERVRWRHYQKTFDKMGLDTNVIDKSIHRLQRAKTALDFYANRFQSALVDVMPQGYAVISKQAFLSIPEEIQIRILIKTIMCISGANKPVPMDTLEKWIGQYPKRATVGGCLLLESKGLLFICREKKRMEKIRLIPKSTLTRWDRFWILSSTPVSVSIGNNDKTLPYLVRQSIPIFHSSTPIKPVFMVKTQKELEKKFMIDYKKRTFEIIYIAFEKGIK